MKCKYIITQFGAILFNEHTPHSLAASGFPKIYSAGFFTNEGQHGVPIEPHCYGESESLDIKSIPEKDIIIVKDMFETISKIKYGLLNVKDFYEE